ncbi:MAG: hypothetical protein WB621_17615, partial [Candidatus Acidiferrales bacterium]
SYRIVIPSGARDPSWTHVQQRVNDVAVVVAHFSASSLLHHSKGGGPNTAATKPTRLTLP